MALTFRNIDASPDDPVDDWGPEGVLAAIENGSLSHWRTINFAVKADPWGPVADWVLQANRITATRDEGADPVAGLLAEQVQVARDRWERDQVATELARLRASAGLSITAMAERLGTSRTRMSAYLSGRTMPSAGFLVRARRLLGS